MCSRERNAMQINRINLNMDGSILTAEHGSGTFGLPPSGPLPDDFAQSWRLGKYKGRVVGDTVEIYAVPGWVPPPPPEPMP